MVHSPIAPGLVFVGGAYLICAVFFNVALPDCIDLPCQTEGVDDSSVTWASNYFLAAACLTMGLHLLFFRNGARKSAILAQVFTGLGFCTWGLANSISANNGLSDGTGLKTFWIQSAISNYSFAFAAVCHAAFAINSANCMDVLAKCWGAFALTRAFTVTTVLAAVANLIGDFWCLASPEVQTDDLRDFDADENSYKDNPMCVRVASASSLAMWLCYALLWLPMGVLLRKSAEEETQTILGLRTKRAAQLATIFQWCTGSIYLVIITLFSALIQDNSSYFIELWEKFYGTEVFHFGMLLTSYCAHNMAWVFLTATALNAKYGVEDESTSDEDSIPPPPRRSRTAERDLQDSDYYVEDDDLDLKDVEESKEEPHSKLWAMTIPNYTTRGSKKLRGTGHSVHQLEDQSVEISMLTNDASMTTASHTVKNTSGGGNWFGGLIESFFLGPKPDPSSASRKSAKSTKSAKLALSRPPLDPIEPIAELDEEESMVSSPPPPPARRSKSAHRHDPDNYEYPEERRAASPLRATSPAARARSPVRSSRHYEHDDYYEYPKERRAASPRRATSPAARARSPVRSSPRHEHDGYYEYPEERRAASPRRATSPAARARSPTRASSPARRATSPSLRVAVSPGAQRAVSPPRSPRPSSPTRNESSRRRPTTSPHRGY